jgi:hypothetical protein
MKAMNLAKMTRAQREAFYTLPKARTIPLLRVKLQSIPVNTTCQALVPHGTNLGTTMGYKLTKFELQSLMLTPILEQILVGILLGDGSIRRPNPGNPIVLFKQGFLHLEYIL